MREQLADQPHGPAKVPDVDPKGGKALTLDARTKLFGKTAPANSNLLMAIKWIGNVGSHTSEIDSDKVLDAMQVYEHALGELYGEHSKKLATLAQKVISSKGQY